MQVLYDILYEILDFCVATILIVLLVVLVRHSQKHIFLHLRHRLYHGFASVQVIQQFDIYVGNTQSNFTFNITKINLSIKLNKHNNFGDEVEIF
jgi:hypothetical protein